MSEIKALKKELFRVREQKRNLEKQLDIWKTIASSDEKISQETGEWIVDLLLQFFGDGFDDLSLPGKLFTAIAWSKYPDKSFQNLLNNLNPHLQKIINEYGINFRILAKGDRYCASQSINNELINCDFEEWDRDIPRSNRSWESDEKLNAEIYEAISDFCFEACREVQEELKERDLLIAGIYLLLLPPASTAESLLEYIKFSPEWAGDDFEECLP